MKVGVIKKESYPTVVKLYKNRKEMDFDDCEGTAPT